MRKWIDLFEDVSPADQMMAELNCEPSGGWRGKSGLFKTENCEIHLIKIKDDLVDVDIVRVPEEHREQGFARKALDLVLDAADRHGVRLQLCVHCSAEDNEDIYIMNLELEQWYERRGFRYTGKHPIEGDYVRLPNAPREYRESLEESVQDPTAICHALRDELLAEAGVSAQEFNSGRCMEFSDELEGRYPNLFDSFELGHFHNHDYANGEDSGDATGFGEKWLAAYPEWQPPAGLTWQDLFDRYGFNWTGMHMWAFCRTNRLCYDIEAVDGVRNVLDLPFFKRIIAHGPEPLPPKLGKTPPGT